MEPLNRVALWSFALVIFAGCASTKVTARDPYVGPKIPRPDRIIVHDFGATPADVPRESALAGHTAQHSTPQTAEEIELGRKLGAEVARQLVAEIQDMGLPATLAAGQAPPRVGDVVFNGYFVSVDPGSAAKRVLVGFGSGAAELQTVLEAYQMTDQGLRRLGGGEVAAGGGKSPGLLLPTAVLVATANPIGLAVSGAAHLVTERTGSAKIEGAGKRTAKEIAKELKVVFKKHGWIS
jgi:hypothetical protein